VFLFTDPIELADGDAAETARRRLYAAVLRAAGIAPLPITPDAPWLHVMAQPTAKGTVHVVYNRKTDEGRETVRVPTDAGEVALVTRNRWPALAAATRDGKLVAVNAYGAASVGADRVMGGVGLKAVLSLDGKDLRRSEAMLVAPFEPGRVELCSRRGRFVALFGEFRDGQWTQLETVRLAGNHLTLDLDADRATCLILLCKPKAARRWAAHLSNALRRPEHIAGY